jgi:hypothetical protein
MFALENLDHAQKGGDTTPQEQKADDDCSNNGGQDSPVPCWRAESFKGKLDRGSRRRLGLDRPGLIAMGGCGMIGQIKDNTWPQTGNRRYWVAGRWDWGSRSLAR